MPTWRERVRNQKHEPFDPQTELFKESKIKGNDLGMVSPTSGSVFRISADGKIDLFAKSNLGIRIDPQTDSIVFQAPRIQMLTTTTNVFTSDPIGFKWNLLPFNPTAIVPGMNAFLPPGPSTIVNTFRNIAEDLIRL